MLFPPAILDAADRLATTLMTLVEAISPILLTGTPTFPSHAVRTLFFRLADLVRTLIRIDNFGIRASAKPATPKARTEPAPIAQRRNSGPAQILPRHPGWLLAALPDMAPAIAADLAALLADPALVAFLAATPTLHRTLRPLLRGLGLIQSPQSPEPQSPETGSTNPASPHTASAPNRLNPAPQPRPAIQAATSNRADRPNPFPRLFHYDIATIRQT